MTDGQGLVEHDGFIFIPPLRGAVGHAMSVGEWSGRVISGSDITLSRRTASPLGPEMAFGSNLATANRQRLG